MQDKRPYSYSNNLLIQVQDLHNGIKHAGEVEITPEAMEMLAAALQRRLKSWSEDGMDMPDLDVEYGARIKPLIEFVLKEYEEYKDRQKVREAAELLDAHLRNLGVTHFSVILALRGGCSLGRQTLTGLVREVESRRGL